jgi:hypothetical protein
MEFITSLIKDAPVWLMAISGVMTSLTVITAITPTKVDDVYLGKATKFLNMLLKLMNVGAGNVLSNKNKNEKG